MGVPPPQPPAGISAMLLFLTCFSVHTVDTTRTTWMLEQMVKIKQPVILVGESGTSKTATTQNFLKNLSEETNVSRSLCSRPSAASQAAPARRRRWWGRCGDGQALQGALEGTWGGLGQTARCVQTWFIKSFEEAIEEGTEGTFPARGTYKSVETGEGRPCSDAPPKKPTCWDPAAGARRPHKAT